MTAGSAGSVVAIAQAQATVKQPQIAIIGGGLAGLNAAYQLKKQGYLSTVYEGRNRLGGRIFSATGVVGKGLTIDVGGHYINSNHADMRSLVAELGLTLFDLSQQSQATVPDAAYFFNNRRITEAELIEQLGPLARQIGEDAALLKEDFDRYGPEFDRLSVADYLKRHARKIPNEVITALITTVIRSEYGVEAAESSTLQLLAALPVVTDQGVDLLSGNDEAFTVQEGTGAIADRLASQLLGRIQLNKKLRAIRSRGAGFQLTFSDNSSVNADYVILAIPSTVLRKLELNVKLPSLLLQSIQEVNLGRNEKLYAGYNSRIWRQKSGFTEELRSNLGFCNAWEETVRQPNSRNAVLGFFFGGKEVSDLPQGSVVSLGQKLVGRFEKFLPGSAVISSGEFFKTQWSNDPFTDGSYSNYKPGQLTKFAKFRYVESDQPSEKQNVDVGNLVFAGEQFSDEYYGYMNGGAQTGRLAAQSVVRKIKRIAS